MDVAGLNRDCNAHVDLSRYMALHEKIGDKFTPLYFVWWTQKGKQNASESVAYVELFLPTKQLLQLTVCDPKYILRPPLVFTNLAALFPGVAPVHTNYPGPMRYMDAPPP